MADDQNKTDYYFDNYIEIDNGCYKSSDIKDTPDLELILGTVVVWSCDEKGFLRVGRSEWKGKKFETHRRRLIAWSLNILFKSMRKMISNEAEEKGCKIHEFIPPKEIVLRRKEPSLKWG